MRGMLSFQILWLISKRKQLCGTEISLELERRRGEKTKAGTLYPALKDLNHRGLIKGKKDGRTIKYSLTAKGKGTVKVAMSYFVRSFGDMVVGKRAT